MKFTYYKKEYDVVKKEVNDNQIIYYLNESRSRKIFAFLPIKVNKFRWLCNVNVTERQALVFNRLFNSSFPDTKYYKAPKETWLIE